MESIVASQEVLNVDCILGIYVSRVYLSFFEIWSFFFTFSSVILELMLFIFKRGSVLTPNAEK